MTQVLQNLAEIAMNYDGIVLDQWGVLHNGTTPYPTAVTTLRALNAQGVPLAVLSNSGKRAAPNADRIAQMGFADVDFALIMTSGDALWQDIAAGRITQTRLFPITRDEGDAEAWADGLDITISDNLAEAEALLLMGLPDRAEAGTYDELLNTALRHTKPILCTNPDRASPRADGETVISPGALAHKYANVGGEVRFYGKPHRPVFDAVTQQLGTDNLLMVGDSLEHDIAGGHAAGWDTVFVTGGLHASHFGDGDPLKIVTLLAKDENAPQPTYLLSELR